MPDNRYRGVTFRPSAGPGSAWQVKWRGQGVGYAPTEEAGAEKLIRHLIAVGEATERAGALVLMDPTVPQPRQNRQGARSGVTSATGATGVESMASVKGATRPASRGGSRGGGYVNRDGSERVRAVLYMTPADVKRLKRLAVDWESTLGDTVARLVAEADSGGATGRPKRGDTTEGADGDRGREGRP